MKPRHTVLCVNNLVRVTKRFVTRTRRNCQLLGYWTASPLDKPKTYRGCLVSTRLAYLTSIGVQSRRCILASINACCSAPPPWRHARSLLPCGFEPYVGWLRYTDGADASKRRFETTMAPPRQQQQLQQQLRLPLKKGYKSHKAVTRFFGLGTHNERVDVSAGSQAHPCRRDNGRVQARSTNKTNLQI